MKRLSQKPSKRTRTEKNGPPAAAKSPTSARKFQSGIDGTPHDEIVWAIRHELTHAAHRLVEAEETCPPSEAIDALFRHVGRLLALSDHVAEVQVQS